MSQRTQIIVTDEIPQSGKQVEDQKIENKTINEKIKELQNKCKEYKKEMQKKDNILKDRKIEVARINATNESNRKEIQMLNHKYEGLLRQKEMLEQTLQKEKSNWNESLSKELQSQYEKYEMAKMQSDETANLMLQQYTSMISEKDNDIKKIAMENKEMEMKMSQMKTIIKEAEKSSLLLKEKNDTINILQASNNDLKKSLEEACQMLLIF